MVLGRACLLRLPSVRRLANEKSVVILELQLLGTVLWVRVGRPVRITAHLSFEA